MIERQDSKEELALYEREPCRENLPPSLVGHSFFAAAPTQAEIDALFKEMVREAYPGGRPQIIASSPAARASEQDARRDDELRSRAEQFGRSLLISVSEREQIMYAAPPPQKPRSKRKDQSMSYRAPALIEARHAAFAGCKNHADFGKTARQQGLTLNHGSHIRTELALFHLSRSEPVPFPFLNARKVAKEGDNSAALVIFSIMKVAHESAFARARDLGLTRTADGAGQLRSEQSALVGELFAGFTDIETLDSYPAARRVIHALTRIVERFQTEVPHGIPTD